MEKVPLCCVKADRACPEGRPTLKVTASDPVYGECHSKIKFRDPIRCRQCGYRIICENKKKQIYKTRELVVASGEKGGKMGELGEEA